MRMSLGNFLALTSFPLRGSFPSYRANLLSLAFIALMNLHTIAWARLHDFPFTEFAHVSTPEQREISRDGQMASLLDIDRLTTRYPSFLADRPKLEDVAEEPQLAASELALLTYRELCRHPFFEPDLQRMAPKDNLDAEDLIAQCVPTTDTIDQPVSQSRLTQVVAPAHIHEEQEPANLQPMFVIWNLEGKEFLVPSQQVMSWNYVPKFEVRQNFPCNQSCGDQTELSQTAASSAANGDSSGGPVKPSNPWSQLETIVADGLENVARKMMQLAAQIRQNHIDREPAEQMATTGADEPLK